MNITVTGGTGFIGRHLVMRLLADGHSIHILARHAKTGFGPDVRCSIWNAYTLEPPRDSLEGADAVVHLAGEPVSQRWTPSTKRRIRDSRVVGTNRLIQAMAGVSPPSVLLSASAMGIYGDRGEEELTESSSTGSGFLSEVCVEWEKAADEAARLGTRVVKLRTGIALGREAGALAQMLPPFHWGLGGQLASGRQWMSWIHVDDLVSLIVFLLTRSDIHGPVNGTSPNPVRNADFTKDLADALGRPALLKVPARGLRLIYGEMAEVLLGSLRVLPAVALAAGFEFKYPTLRPALRNLLG